MIVGADAEKVIKDFTQAALASLPTPPTGQTWKVGTTVTTGVTPVWFIQVRMVGGVEEQRVAQRPLIDLRIWADGTTNTDGIRSATARTLLAKIREQFSCSVFALPVPLPDPADESKIHTLFTIQPLLKGTQS